MEYPIQTARQLALALKGWRKARKWTQAEAAGRVGLLPKTVSALESNPEISSVATLLKLLSALELELTVRPKPGAAGKRTAAGEW